MVLDCFLGQFGPIIDMLDLFQRASISIRKAQWLMGWL